MHPLRAPSRRFVMLTLLSLLLLGLVTSLAAAEERDLSGTRTLVEILPLDGFLDPPVTGQILDVLALAERDEATLVILQLDSPGGVGATPDELLTAVADSPVPVAVFVGPLGTGARAVGAAGLLWLGADVRAVAVDAAVGPLDPVDIADVGRTFPVAVRIASLAAGAGIDQAAAAALADDVLDAQLLEASGLTDLVVASIEQLLVELDGAEVGGDVLTLPAGELHVRFHSLGLLRRVLHAAATGPFIYLLLVAGIGALLFELFQPGFGVAGLAGVVVLVIGAVGVTILPVAWWAVALVVLGLLLYAVDTAIAGFGPITLAATVAFVVGSLNFYQADVLALPVWLVVATAVTAFVFFVLVMTALLRAQAGPEGVQVDDLVGKAGVVRSVLNPEGHVYLDGALWRARWTGDSRRAKVGTPVRVHGVDGPVVLVAPFEPASDGE